MAIVRDEVERGTDLRVDFADARDRFGCDTALAVPSYPGPDGPERFVAVGQTDHCLMALVFSLLGTEAVSVISLRPVSREERALCVEA